MYIIIINMNLYSKVVHVKTLYGGSNSRKNNLLRRDRTRGHCFCFRCCLGDKGGVGGSISCDDDVIIINKRSDLGRALFQSELRLCNN